MGFCEGQIKVHSTGLFQRNGRKTTQEKFCKTYHDGESSVPLVLFSRTSVQLSIFAIGFLDEVSVTQPGDFGLGIGMNVSFKDQDGRIGLFELWLLIDFGRHVLLVVGGSAEVQGKCAILVTHLIDGLDDVVASVVRARVGDGQPYEMDVGIGLLHTTVKMVLVCLFLQLLVTPEPLDGGWWQRFDFALQVKFVSFLS